MMAASAVDLTGAEKPSIQYAAIQTISMHAVRFAARRAATVLYLCVKAVLEIMVIGFSFDAQVLKSVAQVRIMKEWGEGVSALRL